MIYNNGGVMSGTGVIAKDIPAILLIPTDTAIEDVKELDKKSGNNTPISHLGLTQRTASNSIASGFKAARIS